MRKFFPRLATAALFLLVATVFQAQAIDIWRNQTRYDIEFGGVGPITKRGVDRLFTLKGGIQGNLRLIQDNYSECGSLVEERRRNYTKEGFSDTVESKVSQRACQITLRSPNQGRFMSSHYIWLDACRCYAGLHFRYDASMAKRFKTLAAVPIAQLSGGGQTEQAEQPQKSEGRDRFANLDPNAREAIRILHRRGFTPEMAYSLSTNFYGWTIFAGINKPPVPFSDGKVTMTDYIAHVYGVTETIRTTRKYRFADVSHDRLPVPDYAYDVENGYDFWNRKTLPQQMAKNVSNCYRTMDYRTKCKLTYHSQMGCRMTSNWRRFCRKASTDPSFKEYEELCFWSPKGDLPIDPGSIASAEKSVMLPTATAGETKRRKKKAVVSRPSCDDSMLRAYAGRY